MSQKELFPAHKDEWDKEFWFASPEQLIKVDLSGCCTEPIVLYLLFNYL